MLTNIRVFTAIAIIGICGFSVAKGFSIVHFSLARMNLDSSKNKAEIIPPWSAVAGLTATALRAQLTDKIDPADVRSANRQGETLAAILSVEPLSSSDWLSLSWLQAVTDQPTPKVLQSLHLSTVTGPNEGYIMPKRGMLELYFWEFLSPRLKWRAAIDLAAEESTQNGKYQAIVSEKPEATQEEIRTVLIAAGLSREEVDRRLRF
jgi:hypothetical protein